MESLISFFFARRERELNFYLCWSWFMNFWIVEDKNRGTTNLWHIRNRVSSSISSDWSCMLLLMKHPTNRQQNMIDLEQSIDSIPCNRNLQLIQAWRWRRSIEATNSELASNGINGMLSVVMARGSLQKDRMIRRRQSADDDEHH